MRVVEVLLDHLDAVRPNRADAAQVEHAVGRALEERHLRRENRELRLRLGRIESLPDVLRGLTIQFVWVAISMACARLLWARGLKKHTAVGG